MVALVSALGNHYHGLGKRLFHFTIKSHFLLHLADSCKYLHPRASWCYSGEGFMQLTKRIAIACVAGSQPVLVSHKATNKFLAGMGFAVWGRNCWL